MNQTNMAVKEAVKDRGLTPARADFADHVYASSEAKPMSENGADDYLSDEPTGPKDIYDIGSEADRNI